MGVSAFSLMHRTWVFILVPFLLVCIRCTESEDPALAALFTFEIEPLLHDKCFSCHGHDQTALEGDLDLTSRQNMLRGGKSGQAAIIPGDPEASPLLDAVMRIDPDAAMPPKESEQLSESEIAMLSQWIAGGAPWPDSIEKAAIIEDPRWQGKGKITLPLQGSLAEAWAQRSYRREDLWAFLPLRQDSIPAGKHPVDYFIEQKLEEKELVAAPSTNRRILIRRIWLDLTGLPPTHAQMQSMMADTTAATIDQLIDSLLQTRAYGEHMARKWLDVVRYADSDGFSNDYMRPNAWRYRDYVVRSFQQDKPYDQFVEEQIAGDERYPDDPGMLVATGFLRMGPWEHTAMSVARETRQLFLDDVVNSVGETFLSLPLMCARCHDHKFDPIPSVDYYAIQAVFANTQFADRAAPFLPGEDTSLMAAERERIVQWIERTQEAQDRIKLKEENAARDWYADRNQPYIPKRERRHLPLGHQPPRYFGLTNHDLGYRKVLHKRLQTLNVHLQRFEPFAYSVYEGGPRIAFSGRKHELPEAIPDTAVTTFLLQGGSVFAPGRPVSPGTLQAIHLLAEGDNSSADFATDLSTRRTALARWITQDALPLSARSITNRVWQFHFGKGLASDPNNFGVNSGSPSHPQLLDWLANYLIQQQWSIKALHRMIMSSETYKRQSSHPDLNQIHLTDPDNKFLAYFPPRRLEAEEIRDGMLLISGELEPCQGGIPIRPEIHPEVALQPRHIMGSIAQAYQPSRTPGERHRRSIYIERIRSLEVPFLSVFNQPRTELSCGRRNASTVTPQAFTMLNGQDIRSRALAWAISQDTLADLTTNIRQMMKEVWLRTPDLEALSHALQYVMEMQQYHQNYTIPEKDYPKEVSRTMFEEMTGEAFSYREELDIYQDYVPDMSYARASVRQRALADLGIILLNSNEFLYVY